jgi:hypothetical protein
MTTKEYLHRLIDEPSESEAEAALRAIGMRRGHELSLRIVLDDREAERFLDGIEHPAAFEPGLRQLFERSRTLDAADLISSAQSAGVTS